MAAQGPDQGGELSAEQFGAVISAIDELNAADPNSVEVGGRSGPKELLHSELMTEWVKRLDPSADRAQLVAARAHHLQRWVHPRGDYPQGRVGYRRWRTAASRAHADAVAGIISEVGGPTEFTDHVQRIIRKDGLGADPAVELHEDALCLVFLETQLDGLIGSLGPDRATEVLASTLDKMTPAGREVAAGLELSEMGDLARSAALDAPESQNPE